MTEHARYSPSKIEALLQCPKFSYMETLEASNDAALEGTMLHKAAETEDLSGLDEEQQNVVQSFLGYVENIKAAKDPAKPVEDLREFRVVLCDLTWGTADRILIQETVADIFDLKSGRKEVTQARDNKQIRTYGAALMSMRPELERVSGHIVAPRVGPPSSHTFDRSLVDSTKAEIESLYDRLKNPFLAPQPSGELCDHCQWAAQCPALGQRALEVARGIGLPVPAAFRPEAVVAPQDRAIAQVLAGALIRWAEQVKTNNLAYVQEAGGEIPGFSIRARSSGPQIAKEYTQMAIDQLLAAGFAREDEIHSACKLSVPDLAKVTSAVRGTTENEERERMKEILGDAVRENKYTYLQRASKVREEDILQAGRLLGG